ncbi:NAD(P)-dependent oxidoreductase [Aliihoeflea sp. 40Bstr573]|uniref:NAD(P)-dependent oxidoreductase n=1 Tax=Aliihoeflea sp. 40Bstr573 TaxID=2696467 RepID=UPI0020950730|nr:NAD(P)-dependent oxidoreductase [Aliihoeflea sp. 40Bstr573]MCO6388590.1 NAD-binding protein [Aliihoeflea sp. 40Bstr573]
MAGEGADLKLGYIGIGLMGEPMTLRLLQAGRDVVVWNRSRDKLRAVVQAGAQEASSAADLASRCDIVMMCLTDTKAVEHVVFGEDGIAGAARSGGILLDFSSMDPNSTRRFAARLRETTGMGWIDAPVSGGVPGAREGSLAIMAGGEADEIERVRPVIALMAHRFTHMGPSGAGQTTKLCNQVIVGCQLAAIAEAIRLAEGAGVDAAKLPEALKGGFADSIPLQLFAPRMAARSFEPPLGAIHTMLKDLDNAGEAARQAGAPLPMASTARELLRQMAARGQSDACATALVQLYDSIQP